MKKTICIVSVPILLLISGICIFYMVFNNAQFEVKTIKGDAKYLQDVTFKTSYVNKNNNVLEYTLNGDKTTYKMTRGITKEEFPEKYKLEIGANPTVKYEKDETNYFGEPYTEKYTSHYDTKTCTENRVYRKVKEGRIEYNFYIISDVIYGDYIENNEESIISPFTFKSSEENYIREESYTTCDSIETPNVYASIISKEQDEKKDEYYADSVYLEDTVSYFDDKTSYFIPNKRKEDVGDSYLYKLTLKEKSQHQNGPYGNAHTLKVEPFLKLINEREYITMEAIKNQNCILLISTDKTAMYITKYDVEGNLIKEKKISYKQIHVNNQLDMKNELNRLKNNDQYLCFEINNYINVIDFDKMELVESVKQEIKDMAIIDIYYKENTLYLCGIGKNSTNMIGVYHKNNLAFYGAWNVGETKSSDYTGDFLTFSSLKVVR